MAEQKKKWYLSKTMWANIVTLIIGVGLLVDQQLGTSIMTSSGVAAIISIASALGLYGRAVAKTTIN